VKAHVGYTLLRFKSLFVLHDSSKPSWRMHTATPTMSLDHTTVNGVCRFVLDAVGRRMVCARRIIDVLRMTSAPDATSGAGSTVNRTRDDRASVLGLYGASDHCQIRPRRKARSMVSME